MLKVLYILIFLSLSSCSKEKTKENAIRTASDPYSSSANTPRRFNQKLAEQDTYTLAFGVEELKNNEYYITVNIVPDEGSHFLSPLSSKAYKGTFQIEFYDTKNLLKVSKDYLESPASIVEVDPFSGLPAHFVRQKTTYKQKFKIRSDADFEVLGKVQFVIEPKCTMENYNFRVYRKDGVMKIELPSC